jgi:hypothetical protein
MEVHELISLKLFNKVTWDETSATVQKFTIKKSVFVSILPNKNIITYKRTV